jgi:hypothetical protein
MSSSAVRAICGATSRASGKADEGYAEIGDERQEKEDRSAALTENSRVISTGQQLIESVSEVHSVHVRRTDTLPHAAVPPLRYISAKR